MKTIFKYNSDEKYLTNWFYMATQYDVSGYGRKTQKGLQQTTLHDG